MINYKKIFKFILLIITIAITFWILFFKFKILNLKNNIKTKQNVMRLHSSDKELKDVVVFYGDPQSDKLKSYSTKIYKNRYIVNEVKQILIQLFENTPPEYTRVVPEGTVVKEVYIDANSIIYIDLSEEFVVNNKGGTTFEYLSVYSIVKSIFSNFQELRGIKFLINGLEQETVSGHLSIIDIIRPDDIDL